MITPTELFLYTLAFCGGLFLSMGAIIVFFTLLFAIVDRYVKKTVDSMRGQ